MKESEQIIDLVNDMQEKIDALEGTLEVRDETILELESEIDTLTQELEG